MTETGQAYLIDCLFDLLYRYHLTLGTTWTFDGEEALGSRDNGNNDEIVSAKDEIDGFFEDFVAATGAVDDRASQPAIAATAAPAMKGPDDNSNLKSFLDEMEEFSGEGV